MLQRILDFIWGYGEALFGMFFAMFFLAGCTAYVASPVTVPIWILLGVYFPRFWVWWRGFTLLHILTFSFVASLSFIGHNWPIFTITTILAVVTLVLWFIGRSASKREGVVRVQTLVAVIGFGTILTYMLSPQ